MYKKNSGQTLLTLFLFKGHNSPKNNSSVKTGEYAQEYELPINRVKFNLNCISTIREAIWTNFENKNN
jgi:hypothetical protein